MSTAKGGEPTLRSGGPGGASKSPLALNLALMVLVLLLTIFPFFLARGGEFSGADDQAEAVISQIDANYRPWLTPLWEPPSGEVESFLFALQAALGGGFVGYYLGFIRGRKKAAADNQ